MDLLAFLEGRGKLFWGVVGIVFIFLLGVVDYVTGFEINISFFYLIPIGLLSWYAGRQLGLFAAAASSITWFMADYTSGLLYSHPAIYVWNASFRLVFFGVVSWLISVVHDVNKENQELVRVDFVTGAVSVRYFYELAKIEIKRAERYKRPFTFAYIDLDNFKSINDRLGHSIGDRVLRAVTESIQSQIRPTDSLGRLGGDEFALLLPETDEAHAKNVIQRIHSSLVNEMLKNSWMVTFSVGVVTFCEPPASVDEMVKLADSTMYKVKTHGKNGVSYHVHGC
ncbi:MAG TPA: diguanylate cyclase [Anaerolineales bacterium]|nr:diguanylate cyclase [Anaerolineales bacterium]